MAVYISDSPESQQMNSTKAGRYPMKYFQASLRMSKIQGDDITLLLKFIVAVRRPTLAAEGNERQIDGSIRAMQGAAGRDTSGPSKGTVWSIWWQWKRQQP
ncbi:hypothetical protein ACH4VM_18915 [Streptomyces sp. NPDC020792]|uniref:hypothetical protein n=1 Tax=Streptomyces sp. NPDC020792 TaxID=3365089 RepID=UPI003792C8B2